MNLIFYYHRLNRYSLNALAGALDVDPDLSDLPITLARTPTELHKAAAGILSRNQRVVIAFSILTAQWPEAARLLAQLRAEYRRRIVAIAGGPHVTADPDGVLNAGFDVVFRGEAEVAFPRALKRLADGPEGQSFIDSRTSAVDIDAFPSFSAKRKMFGPIEITRGCPFACSFCQTSHIFGTRPRHRTVENIVRQAASLHSKNGRVVRLLSPNAFSYGSPEGRQLNLSALRELLETLHRSLSPNSRIVFGYFPSEVRPEHVTPETLDLLRRFSCNDEIVIGAQSGSRAMLNTCNRSHSVADILTAVTLARKFGFKVIVDFIFGLPGETEEDTKETVSVMKTLGQLGARIHPHIFAPLPQTAFAKKAPGQVSPEAARALEILEKAGALYGHWCE